MSPYVLALAAGSRQLVQARHASYMVAQQPLPLRQLLILVIGVDLPNFQNTVNEWNKLLLEAGEPIICTRSMCTTDADRPCATTKKNIWAAATEEQLDQFQQKQQDAFNRNLARLAAVKDHMQQSQLVGILSPKF
jgi:hypothetical protein